MMNIDRGFLCYNTNGELGMVMSIISLPENSKSVGYSGIHLGRNKFGETWTCDNPHIAGIIDLNTGNIKVPSATKIIDLPNATVIKLIPPQEYGLLIEETPSER